MATSIGQIGLDLVINQNQFNKQLSGITGLAKKAGIALAAAFSVKKIVDFGKSCINLGSDLQEVQNVVDVTFPHMTAKVDEFAKSAAASFGLSEKMAKQYTGTFGAMAKAFGFTEQQAYDMGTTLTGLAGDVASFYNITQDEAYTKLKSVFSGETETLKDLGVVMTQNALDAYAMANGWGKTTQAMSEAEKVSLRYAFVQEQLSAASGDFIRTSDSWANQVRILKLQFDSLKATIGQGLINVFTPILKVINTLLGKLATLANAFKAFTELLTGKKSSSKATASGLSDIADSASSASSGLNSAGSSADRAGKSASSAGKAAKQAAKDIGALGIDEFNTLSAKDTDSGTGGGGGGTGGGGGASAVDYGSLSTGETVLDSLSEKYEETFEKIRKQVQPTIDSFKRLWNEGLAQFGNFTWTALKDFYNDFLVPVGKWTLGTGIPQFIDALNTGLLNVDWGRLTQSLDDLWKALAPFAINIGEGLLWFWKNVLVPLGTWTANEVVPRFLETLTTVIGIFNHVLEALQPLFQWFWDKVLQPLAEWTGGIFLSVWDKINGALKTFSDWCSEHSSVIEGIAIVIGSFFAAWKIVNLAAIIGEVVSVLAGFVATGGLAAAAATLLSGAIALLTSPITIAIAIIGSLIAVGVLLYKNWETIQTKAIEIWGAICDWFSQTCAKIGEFFSSLWSGIKETFASVGEWFREKFQSAYDYITGIFQGIGTWFSNRYNDVTKAFSKANTWFSEKFEKAYSGVTKAFKDIKTWATERYNNVTSAFSSAATWFGDKFEAAFKAMKGAFSGISQWASELWSDIVGKFTDIGTQIGDAVGGAFKQAINSAIQTIENAINGGIGLINSAIGMINKIPGVSVGEIEPIHINRLAQGGYVKANTPQLAMIGDNRHYGEIVAPEDKMLDMIDTALRMRDAQSSNGDPMFQTQLLSLLKEIIEILESLDLTPSIDIYQLKKNLDDVGKRKGFSF